MLKWFKKKEFQEKELKCPRCEINMEKLRKYDVLIDYCKKCKGIWLDDKEIDKLYGYYSGKQNLKNRKK